MESSVHIQYGICVVHLNVCVCVEYVQCVCSVGFVLCMYFVCMCVEYLWCECAVCVDLSGCWLWCGVCELCVWYIWIVNVVYMWSIRSVSVGCAVCVCVCYLCGSETWSWSSVLSTFYHSLSHSVIAKFFPNGKACVNGHWVILFLFKRNPLMLLPHCVF